MKKLFISQPMRELSDEEILKVGYKVRCEITSNDLKNLTTNEIISKIRKKLY